MVYVDLAALYDTIWRESLLYKFFNMVLCSRTTSYLNNMRCHRLLQIITEENKSKLRYITNRLLQNLIHAPGLLNLYNSDMPHTASKAFGYIDASRSKTTDKASTIISKDLFVLRKNFVDWKLIPHMNKTEVS